MGQRVIGQPATAKPATGQRNLDEFGLIRRFFAQPVTHTALGVGDDAALIDPTPGCQTVAACDMLVEGVHFFAGTDPRALGHKALAVNLSDLAAMGATPRQALLGIALPAADEVWLAAFAEGFARLAERFGVDWVGGDTTRGPLNLCVTVLGEVPCGAALLRSGARPGDDIWVSGVPGLAALGLAHLRGECVLEGRALAAALERLHTPEPRVAVGIGLRGVASACIDISDGLLADLAHLLRASGAAAGAGAALSAEIDWNAVAAPVLAALRVDALAADLAGGRARRGRPGSGSVTTAPPVDAAPPEATLVRRAVLSGGDDYELICAAPPAARQQVAALAEAAGVALTRIGYFKPPVGASADASGAEQAPSQPLITLLEGDLRTAVSPAGYLHFG